MTYYTAIWAYNKVCIQLADIVSSWQNNVNMILILMSENSSVKSKKLLKKEG